MNNENLKRKVRETAYEILKNQVFIGPVDLLTITIPWQGFYQGEI